MFYLKYYTENSQGMWLLVILHLFTQQTLILPNREEPMEWLISTKSLLNAHVAYNTRYKAFICTLCHAAVSLKELTGHLMAKVQHVVFDAPGYFPHSCPPHIWERKIVHHLTPPIPYRSFGSFVCAEMRKHGINIGNKAQHHQYTTQGCRNLNWVEFSSTPGGIKANAVGYWLEQVQGPDQIEELVYRPCT